MKTTTITGYRTSRDHGLLAELIRQSSIVCIVRNHSFPDLRVVASSKFIHDEGCAPLMLIGSPGISYVDARTDADFIAQCASQDVEFLMPRKLVLVGRDTQLLPCPFCNEPAEIDTQQFYRHYQTGEPGTAIAIYCVQCTAQISVCRKDAPDITAEEIISMWNTRALISGPSITALQAILKAMEQERETIRGTDDAAEAVLDRYSGELRELPCLVQERRAAEFVTTPAKSLPTIAGLYWWRENLSDPWQVLDVRGFGPSSANLTAYPVTPDTRWSGRTLLIWPEYFPIGEWLYIHPPPQTTS